MMLLLDTHVFLWSIMGERLSERARAEYLDTANDLYFSAASYWEICIKKDIGKLVLAEGWEDAFDREMRANGIKWLPVKKEHCQTILELPRLHEDPFDRLLLGQARYESMTIMTADANIQKYDVDTIW